MLVLKFGGTSVGTPERLEEVISIASQHDEVIVVVSAISGMTDELLDIAKTIKKGEVEAARKKSKRVSNRFIQFSETLLENSDSRAAARFWGNELFDIVTDAIEDKSFVNVEATIVSLGEQLSSYLFHLRSIERGIPFSYLDALSFMSLDKNNEPNVARIQSELCSLIEGEPSQRFITQGFICRDVNGAVSNLKRGGSDYSAALIGAAINAEQVEIWTDISGMHNNDPRVVDETHAIANLSYDEAAELAYFGAKILHPMCVFPAQAAGIPLLIKNTMAPNDSGTYISDRTSGAGVKAIAAKDNITAIKIKSSRMLMAYGFLRNVFEVFERHRTPIDMITTSEVAVSLTIDDDSKLDAIVSDLSHFGQIEIDQDQSIVCLVGDLIAEANGYASHIFRATEDIPLRMVSYGGSKNNVSLLIESQHKVQLLNALNAHLFTSQTVSNV